MSSVTIPVRLVGTIAAMLSNLEVCTRPNTVAVFPAENLGNVVNVPIPPEPSGGAPESNGGARDRYGPYPHSADMA
jgi:hypothetical protein